MIAEGLLTQFNHYFTEVTLFSIGDVGITLSHVAVSIASFLSAIIISKLVRISLKRRLFKRFHLDEGVEYAILRFTHYLILIVGIYIGLKTINLPLGAMVGVFAVIGVGIGFGLQNVVSNFISGIILLIERPLKVGDRIGVDDLWGDVIMISLRTTLIRTPDNVMIVVPNSKLLENNVINYSFRDKRIRLRIPVGVAYGSDVDRVKKALLSTAEETEEVLPAPTPAVWFREFGDSSLNFELLAWIGNPSRKHWVTSELNGRIDKAFRAAGIEIPFPQRDLHLRSSTHALKLETTADQ